MKKFFCSLVLILLVGFFFVSCSDAEVASSNVSKAADQFEIFRRVVFYNGITDEYILVVEGYCSVLHDSDGDINIMVKVGPGKYIKHMLGPSDNVTWFSQQLEPTNVSDAQYRVIFKPSVILPSIDME
jgi:hypothetical protein